MIASPNAIFLSYARDDAAAARRIAEALRSSGLEVWFDENELRGGDAWDAKIRKQINDCRLFVPVISQHTQERNKGYFRLEWKLAVDQTHLLAEGVPFIAPVVIDDTRETEAIVPAEFLKVQWTRLSGALPTLEFVAQVRRLSIAPRAAENGRAPARSISSSETKAGMPRNRRKSVWTATLAALAIVISIAVWFTTRKSDPPAAPKVAAELKARPPAALAISEKSIAILPFDNLSDDRESGYFADGVQGDILTNLTLIRELKVVSRTSAMQYRGTKKSMRQIGEELGAAYVLGGSVRRAGGRIRVTGELIKAQTDEYLWAKSYEKELTDVFAIQAALATEIAGALHAVISPQEKKLIERRPTENPTAHDLYLKARDKTRVTNRGGARGEAVALLEAAVQLDPKFTDAWVLLCYLHAFLFERNDRTDARQSKAKLAMDNAFRLAPDSPDVIRAVGDYHLYCTRDYERSVVQYQRILRLLPDDTEALKQLSAVERRLGRWEEMLAHVRKYLELDPGDLFVRRNLVGMLLSGRRYGEARICAVQNANLQPDDLHTAFALALLPFYASGSTVEMEALFATWTEKQASSTEGIGLRKTWAVATGNLPEWTRLNEMYPAVESVTSPLFPVRSWSGALLLAAKGDVAGARAIIEMRRAEIRRRLASEVSNDALWAELGELEAVHGDRDEALRCARKAVELLPESVEKSSSRYRTRSLAFVYAWTGDKDRAIGEYARLLKLPDGTGGGLNIHLMKLDPRYAPLRGDPRWEALLNDPKNNAPLF